MHRLRQCEGYTSVANIRLDSLFLWREARRDLGTGRAMGRLGYAIGPYTRAVARVAANLRGRRQTEKEKNKEMTVDVQHITQHVLSGASGSTGGDLGKIPTMF